MQARYWAAKMNLEIEMAECEDVLRVFETACAPLLAAFPEQSECPARPRQILNATGFIKLETLHAMMLDVIWRGQTLLGQMP